MIIDDTELKLLLERKRDHIGRKHSDGPDKIVAGISLFASAVAGTYASILFVPGFLLKAVFILISILLLFWGLLIMIKSDKYGHDNLYKDIENIKADEHPFSIVAIKDTFADYPNRFLLYYDSDWDCWFFPNYRTTTDDMHFIQERLSGDLQIRKDGIQIARVAERLQRKFSRRDKIDKWYRHTLYSVNIPADDKISNDSFEIRGRKYKWMSLQEMNNDSVIHERNQEVVNFVSESIA